MITKTCKTNKIIRNSCGGWIERLLEILSPISAVPAPGLVHDHTGVNSRIPRSEFWVRLLATPSRERSWLVQAWLGIVAILVVSVVSLSATRVGGSQPKLILEIKKLSRTCAIAPGKTY